MLGWLWPNDTVVAVIGDHAAPRHHPAACHLGRPAARASQTPARGARQDRCLPRRRALHRPVARALPHAAGPPLGPSPDPAAAAVFEAPLPARLRDAVPRGRRLDRLAAVLPHPAGPARPAPHYPEQAGATLRPRHHRRPEHRAAGKARRRQAAALPQAAGRHHRRRRERGLPDRCGTAGAGDRQAGRHEQAGAGCRGCAPDQDPGSSPRGAPPGTGGRAGAAVTRRCRQTGRLRGDQAGRRPGRSPARRRRADRGRRPSRSGAAPQRG